MEEYVHQDLVIEREDVIRRGTRNDLFYLSKGLYLPRTSWEKQILQLDEVQVDFTDAKPVMTPARDLINLIIDLDSKKRMYDGNGDLISTSEKQTILDNIVGIHEPWRGENLDNYFHVFNNVTYMDTNHIVINGEVVHTKRIPVSFVRENGLTSFKYFNEDGLASKLKGEEVYFTFPNNKSVARFGAGSGGAYLSCDRNPSSSYAELGVRAKFLSLP